MEGETTPLSSAARRRRPNGWWLTADLLTISAGVLVGCFGALVTSLLLPPVRVDPRRLALVPADPHDGSLPVVVGLVALALVAAAGLPRRGMLLAGRSAVGQAIAAGAAGFGTVVGTALSTTWLFGPEDKCAYDGCWPSTLQGAAAALPAFVAVVALVSAALLARRAPWSPRALVPAAAWLLAVLLVRNLWEPLLLPVLQSPPP